MDADVIVIGSGFGGSVCAARAAQARRRVLLLERGRFMTDDAYARLACGEAPLWVGRHTDGLIDAQRHQRLLTLGGCAVGGGSHVYTAVTVRPPPDVFIDSWPVSLRHSAMEPYYERVASVLKPSPLTSPPRRTLRLHEIGRSLNVPVTTLPLLIESTTEDSIDPDTAAAHPVRASIVRWLRGGAGYRKRTLDGSYLALAADAGAKMEPSREVVGLTVRDGGYRLRARRRDEIGGFVEYDAPRVVVATGTMNTLRLLLSARGRHGALPQLSRRLGERFFMNGDYGGLLIGRRLDIETDAGPPVTAWIDHWRTDRLFLMETGALARGLLWSFGVMGFDTAPGRITLGSGGRLIHTRAPGAGDDFHAARVRRLRELADAANARLLIPPDVLTRRLPTTVHPLGGAAMADDPAHGVTNDFGEVWGYPGLFIADGSLLPTPTGVPPSMTIAALAERVAEGIIGHA